MMKKTYCRIPAYGQLMLRKGTVPSGWFKDGKEGRYYSLMLKGARRSLFGSNTFYLVFTEHCLEEAITRGELNTKYLDAPLAFGKYVGAVHIDTSETSSDNLKHKFDCIFLHVFRYLKGGKIEDKIIALSDRQFRRAIVRAKTHPALVCKRHFWHGAFMLFYRLIGQYL